MTFNTTKVTHVVIVFSRLKIQIIVFFIFISQYEHYLIDFMHYILGQVILCKSNRWTMAWPTKMTIFLNLLKMRDQNIIKNNVTNQKEWGDGNWARLKLWGWENWIVWGDWNYFNYQRAQLWWCMGIKFFRGFSPSIVTTHKQTRVLLVSFYATDEQTRYLSIGCVVIKYNQFASTGNEWVEIAV